MVSLIGNDSSQNAVAQVLPQQVAEQRRQAQIELVAETKVTQRQ